MKVRKLAHVNLRKACRSRTFLQVFLILIVGSLFAAAKADSPPPQYRQAYASSPYDFRWAVKDDYSENDFGHQESMGSGGVTSGEYYVLLPDGRTQRVAYTANDYDGYKAEVTYNGEAKAKYPKASYKHKPAPTYHKSPPQYPKPAPSYYKPAAPSYPRPSPPRRYSFTLSPKEEDAAQRQEEVAAVAETDVVDGEEEPAVEVVEAAAAPEVKSAGETVAEETVEREAEKEAAEATSYARIYRSFDHFRPLLQ